MLTNTFRAMGSQILAAIDAPAQEAAPALRALPETFAAWEQSLSRFRPDSELSALNRTLGGWVLVSSTLAEVIAAALRAAAMTDGLVTPTLLEALERTGYDRDFAELAGSPEQAVTPARPAPAADWRALKLDSGRRAVRLARGMRLDLGGIAKGWAADQTARRLKATGPALVDVGGDIAVSGPRTDGTPWPIGVGDPHGGEAPLAILLLYAGAAATSGRDYRRWRQGGVERHHIIDPRTGLPACTDLLSATVVAPNATEAEVAAKAALILGSEAGLSWLVARPWLAGLLVREDGQQLRTANLDAYCWGS